MRRAGQDEAIGAKGDQFIEAFGALLVRPYDAERRTAAQQREAGPQVRADDQVVIVLGIGRLESGLAGGADRVRRLAEAVRPFVRRGFETGLGIGPSLFLGRAGDQVDTDRALDAAAERIGLFLDRGELGFQLLERFQPG